MSEILTNLGVHMGKVVDKHAEAVSFKEINIILLRTAASSWTHPRPFIDRVEDKAFIQGKVQQAKQLFVKFSPDYGLIQNEQLWGWKDPRTSITLPVWLELFPKAKIIHVIRNGIDVALSLYRREWKYLRSFLSVSKRVKTYKSNPNRYFTHPRDAHMFPPTISRGYGLWREYLNIIANYEAQFKTVSWHTIFYEQFILDPMPQIETLCEFLDLQPSSELIQNTAKKTVGRPTQPSKMEKMQVKLLYRLNFINLQPVIAWPGYEQVIQPYL